MEISTKTHLLELSTVVHVVKNHIKCILLKKRPRESFPFPIAWPNLPCLPDLLFKQHMTKAINQYNFHKVRLIGPAFLTNALLFGLNNSQSIYHVRACRKANLPTDIGSPPTVQRLDHCLSTQRQSGEVCRVIWRMISREFKTDALISLAYRETRSSRLQWGVKT